MVCYICIVFISGRMLFDNDILHDSLHAWSIGRHILGKIDFQNSAIGISEQNAVFVSAVDCIEFFECVTSNGNVVSLLPC